MNIREAKERVLHNKKRIIETVFIMIALLFCEWFFFRNIIFTGTGALISDRADGRLTMLLTEHWWKFFNGKEKFSEIAMFFPVDDAFGYTDLFLGYGILHSLLRVFGFNMYVAFKWTLVFTHLFGTFTTYYLLKRKLNVSTGWSLFGTMAFCFSDTYARFLVHTQLNAVAYLPLLLILFVGFIENYNTRYKRNIYAYCMIGWFVLLTYNSWYVACFTGLFALFFIIVYLICLKRNKIKVLSLILQNIKYLWKDLIGYFLYMVILFVPFIKIYLPVMQKSSGYNYRDCVMYMPEIADIINVSEGNFMMGRIIEKLDYAGRGYSFEVVEGFSVILLGLFIASVLVHKKHSNDCKSENDAIRISVMKALYISVVIGVFSVVRLSANGISMWKLIYKVIPVVRSMRAVARFWLWLSFPMAIITAYSMDKYWAVDNERKKKSIIAAFVVLLFVSNINKVGVSTTWKDCDEIAFIESIADMPEDIKSFYIIDTAKTGDPGYIYQLDAFEIATVYGTKTINGYSGQSPSDWDGLWDVCSKKYELSAFEWVKNNRLENVYAYDRAENVWIPIEKRIEESMDNAFYPSENKASLSYGFHDWDNGEFAWTEKKFETQISNGNIQKDGLHIIMRSEKEKYLMQGVNDDKIRIYVDDEPVKEVEAVDGIIDLIIPMDSHSDDLYSIRIETECYFVPADIGENGDSRELSLGIYYIGE